MNIDVTTVLDRGASYLGNHPDDLARRTVLAQVLVDGRAVKSIDAGVLAFRIWTAAEAKLHGPEKVCGLADEKARQ